MSGAQDASGEGPPKVKASAPAFTSEEVLLIRSCLLSWYSENRRKLPWRGDPLPYSGSSDTPTSSSSTHKTPASGPPESELPSPPAERTAYGTWVSEIMLQQTRVETVIRYWLTWMQTFPTVNDLAAASDDEVKAKWAGLGYYRRASNLLKGAQFVRDKYQGVVPGDVKSLKDIPGIGDYTAGAISSIAFGNAVPLVDGNVVRVFSRLRAIGGVSAKSPVLAKMCWALGTTLVSGQEGQASALPPVERPGDFNQSLMELGATVCTPRSPSCKACPLRASSACLAFEEGKRLVEEKGVDGLLALVAAEESADSSDGQNKTPAKAAGAATSSAKGKTSTSGSATSSSSAKQTSLMSFFGNSKKAASTPAATASSSSSSSMTAQKSAVGDIEDLHKLSDAHYSAIARYIEAKYPQKADKKAVPTVELAAFVLIKAPAPASPDPAATPSGHRVWLQKRSSGAAGPDAEPKGVDDGDDIEVVEEENCGEAEGDDDAGQDEAVGKKRGRQSAASSSSSAAKLKRAAPAKAAKTGAKKKERASQLLEGQWQPIMVPLAEVIEKPLAKETAPTSAKRAKKAAVGGGAADDAEASEEVVVVLDGDDDEDTSKSSLAEVSAAAALAMMSPAAVASLQKRILDVTGLTLALRTTATSGGSAGAEAHLLPCGTVTHVFSHVIHRVRVYSVVVPADAGAVASASSVAHGKDARWLRLEEFETVGLTTWAVKILYAGLSTEGGATGSSAVKFAGADSDAFSALQKRWELAKGKITV